MCTYNYFIKQGLADYKEQVRKKLYEMRQKQLAAGFLLAEALIGASLILVVITVTMLYTGRMMQMAEHIEYGNELAMDARFIRAFVRERIQGTTSPYEINDRFVSYLVPKADWGFTLAGGEARLYLSNMSTQIISLRGLGFKTGRVKLLHIDDEPLLEQTGDGSLRVRFQEAYMPSVFSQVYPYGLHPVELDICTDYSFWRMAKKKDDL